MTEGVGSGTIMWAELIADSFRRPRLAARRLYALDPPAGEIWLAMAMVACLETVALHAALAMMPAELAALFGGAEMHPLLTVLEQLVALMLAALVTERVGALFGGRGTLKRAAAAVLWVSFVSAAFPVLAVLATMVSPVLAGLLALAAAGWMLWAFASFVAELHGFQRLAPVMFGVVATWVVLVVGLSMLFAILGLTPQEGA